MYSRAVRLMNSAGSENDFLQAKSSFETLGNYKDSAEKAEECLKSAEAYRKKYLYNRATADQEKDTIHDLESAILKFNQILAYKDSAERVQKCKARIVELSELNEAKRIEMERKQKEEEERQAELTKKRIKIGAIASVFIIVCIILGIVISGAIENHQVKEEMYNHGISLLEDGFYDDAIAVFESINSYKDSSDKVDQIKYNKALTLIESGSYVDAIALLEELGDFEGASEKIMQLNAEKDDIYKNAETLLEQGLYDEAIAKFKQYGSMYVYDKDASYNAGNDFLNSGSYIEAIAQFAVLGDD